jgi:hypothetical protein
LGSNRLVWWWWLNVREASQNDGTTRLLDDTPQSVILKQKSAQLAIVQDYNDTRNALRLVREK